MIEKIMQHEELKQKAPVLIDVGASGGIHNSWSKLAPYSICIGFDGDVRETDFKVSENEGYKKLYLFNKIVGEAESQTNFFLTKSPFCSSRLEPNYEELQNWAFGDLFEIEKKINLESTSIESILNQLHLDYVDWFKTDSQGTDLRIFKSIPERIRNKILITEFEPGIINAYKSEDLLFDLMSFMYAQPFWMSKMIPKGSQRIQMKYMDKYFYKFKTKLHDFRYMLNESSAWAEVTYLNTFKNIESFSKRDLLLGCAVAIANKQYGYAIDLSEIGLTKFPEETIFNQIINFSVSSVTKKKLSVYFYKILNKVKRIFT
ncbi:MAG: hypothetical protein AB7G20_10390 [Sulfurimonas sp.]|uniref:hypothetical protein n=1 Tax=Sulfurimonas sp. TaxID=2022749 RepID=UPI003D134BC7